MGCGGADIPCGAGSASADDELRGVGSARVDDACEEVSRDGRPQTRSLAVPLWVVPASAVAPPPQADEKEEPTPLWAAGLSAAADGTEPSPTGTAPAPWEDQLPLRAEERAVGHSFAPWEDQLPQCAEERAAGHSLAPVLTGPSPTGAAPAPWVDLQSLSQSCGVAAEAVASSPCPPIPAAPSALRGQRTSDERAAVVVMKAPLHRVMV